MFQLNATRPMEWRGKRLKAGAEFTVNFRTAAETLVGAGIAKWAKPSAEIRGKATDERERIMGLLARGSDPTARRLGMALQATQF